MSYRWVWVLLVSEAALAQSMTGSIGGMVQDTQGGLVAGATVVARETGTGTRMTTSASGEGFYRLANLIPGEYLIEVTVPGFRTASLPVGRVGAGEAVRLDATLQVGEVTESVTVQAAATQVTTDEAQLGRTVREIPLLPLLSGSAGRNPLALLAITPGVSAYIATSQPGNFSVNGQRVYANNFVLDGGNASFQVTGAAEASVASISPHALAELRLVTGAMKAEYGRNSGSTAIATVKSGTNAFHGVLAETFRNTRLNAAPFFQKTIAGGTPERLADGSPRNPPWKSNDFDANLGGPIRKDQTFFFVSYLGFRRRLGVRASSTVPSAAERAAIETQGTREARALLALIPPATSGNLLLSAPADALTRDQGIVKLEHAFSAANRGSATYFIEDGRQYSPFPGHGVPGFGVDVGIRQQNLVLRDTHVFSPALFHDARVTFHRNAQFALAPRNRMRLRDLGLTGIVPDDPNAEGPPWVVIAGLMTFGNMFNGPQAYKTNQFQFADTMSWARGRHFVKFGGEARTFAMNTMFINSPNGSITIEGGGTRSNLVAKVIPGLSAALNDFANGFATTFAQSSSARVAHRSRAAGAFVQDDWKVRPNLTLNLGLRWEYNGGYTDLRDRMVTLRPGQQSAVFPDAPLGLVYPGDAGVERSTYRPDYNDFSPRFGFAWDVAGNGRLAVRGGYGLFYDAPFQEILMGASLFWPPFSIRAATSATDYADPWVRSRVNPIPPPFPYRTAQPGERVDFTRLAPVTFTFLDPGFRTPYGQQWNVQVQWQARRDWLVETGYTGSVGVKLSNERQYNYAVAGPGATTLNTDRRRLLNLGNPQNGQYGGAVFGSVWLHTGNANSNYHALHVQVLRRMARGLQLSHAYTWSHTIDNASGRRVSSRNDPRQDRGNSDTDLRHRYVLTAIYELPGRSRLRGGWGVSGLATFQSGLPDSVAEPEDRCLCATGNIRADATGGPIRYLEAREGRNYWFDGAGGGSATAAANPYFRRVGTGPSWTAGAGRYGNAGRNTLRRPGVNNWNLAGFKRTRVREGQQLELRAEWFNAFNHTQFLTPNTNIGSTLFGRVTATRDPRIVQLGLRYLF